MSAPTPIEPGRIRHFKRCARLTVYRENAPLFDEKFEVERHQGDANGIIIEAMRIEFTVERTLKKHPNNCSVKLTNLNEASRAALQRKPLQVIVEAGYDGVYRQMYVGDVTFGMSTHDGTEWTSILQLGDGDRVYCGARVNRSYPAGTSVKTILRDAVGSIGQPLPKNIEESKSLDTEFAGGEVLFGNLRDELGRLLSPHGYTWSFQDGRLQMLGPDETEDGEFLISEATGMIGSPDFGTPPRNGKPPNITVRSLLYPDLRPGKTVRVESRALKGRFKIEKVTHKGDTHGGPWETVVEIKATAGTSTGRGTSTKASGFSGGASSGGGAGSSF